MYVIGEKNIFAIEWALEKFIHPYYYGYLCFWINGSKVGNLEEISTLSICANYLKDFLENKKLRNYEGSSKMSKETLFYQIHGIFFDGSHKDSDAYSLQGSFSDIYWLDEVGEYSFRDKISMILVNEFELERERLIWKELDNGRISEYFLPLRYFETVAVKFLTAHEVGFQD
ncbi:MAG TPA: Imm42 family immunity protein [Chitinophagaceae bacterium]|jgi:phage terminase large subunit|nr:Imm42 family immunity protein [Chitinophagaceae bacterium]